MRTLAMIALFCPILALACGEAAVGPHDSPPATLNSEAEAGRVFEIAENLEKSGRAQEATEAYQQILREYPQTAQGKKAAARLKGSQKRR